jgi:ribonuclease BN (tRNA processing enzyme)
MKAIFIGVGDAFDERETNTSILIDFEGTRILLDCGFTVPKSLFSLIPDADSIDAVFISHFHGDHFMGVPYLLGHMRSAGRKSPLTFIGPKDIEQKIISAVNFAYPTLLSKLEFNLFFEPLTAGEAAFNDSVVIKSVPVVHSVDAFAIKMKCNGFSLYYSGDGCPGEDAFNLAEGCDLIIHESWGIEKGSASHGSVSKSIELARSAGCRTLALIHVYSRLRDKLSLLYKSGAFAGENFEIVLPEQGDELIFN